MLFIAAAATVMSIEFEVVVLVVVESAIWKVLSMLFLGCVSVGMYQLVEKRRKENKKGREKEGWEGLTEEGKSMAGRQAMSKK
jgi:hypothetical protein